MLAKGDQVLKAFGLNAFCIAVQPHTGYPWEAFLDVLEEAKKSGLREDQGVAVGDENPALTLAVTGRKVYILIDGFFGLDSKPNPFVCATEGTLVVRTAPCHLEDDTVGFAWGSNDNALIIHFAILMTSGEKPPDF
jgi:hypothetical protein